MNKKYFILLFVFLFIFQSLLFSVAESKKDSDEIIAIKHEIQQIKLMLSTIINSLSDEQKKSLKSLIKKLEIMLENKKKVDRYSETSRKVNRLKLKIDEIKEKIEELSGGVQFSGFFDVSASTFKNNPNIFALGDFELDMEKSFGENFQVGAAFVFNDDGAELAVGFIDFHIFGGPISARGRLFTEKGLHFQLGRFDVPFGNDWQYYASVDRKSITAPLSTEFVMDGGYNDVGFRILRGDVFYNFTLFMLKGIEEGVSYGGRFGLTPFNNPYTLKQKKLQKLEIGVSYLHDQNRDSKREERAFALDFESSIGPFHLRGEYLKRDNDLDEMHFSGFHISGFLDAGKFFNLPVTVFTRYDWFQSELYDIDTKETLSRISAGLHFDVFEITVLKFEFNHFLEENEEFAGSSFFAQIVITF